MKKIILTEKDVHEGYLILINPQNLLNKVLDSDVLESYNDQFSDIKINKVANKHLQSALKNINAKDKIVPVSGYRSLKEQISIINDSIKENGTEFTYKYVALPNASEHQTGLAIDLGLNQPNIDFIRPSFPYNGICEEFRSIAMKYGFIERYKKEKESITTISAEEWHFRYVGYPHSEIIAENNYCLEEYIEYLKHNKIKYKNFEIEYIPFNNVPIEIELGPNDQISGNNVDGFIITRDLS